MPQNKEESILKNDSINCASDTCGEIISSQTLPLSSGTTITPTGTRGPLVAKIPVVLSEREIQIDVEAEFRLEEPYYEIKRIKKNVYLTQCELLPRICVNPNGSLKSGKLFISGFVRKNIEYATADCVQDKIVSGKIAHTTIDVPFTNVTEITYFRQPVINHGGVQTEIDYLNNCSCNDCGETVIGKLGCQQIFEENRSFTEKPYCELEEVKIIEVDLHRDPLDTYAKFDVQLYDKVIEKMVIYVTVKVLQLQQVNISAPQKDYT
jgi:hypothetical protein